ncbi:MAG: diguanylate cyclase [Atribacteria sp.]|nr:diguanylate cyclase [Candidatus Atribacteria bacterium]MBU4503516.1 diguanylate cyclase [Pseudomonadota bacterium]
MILITIVALSSLNEANRTSKNIIEHDIVLLETANNMLNSLLAQESYGRRYLILDSQEILELFWQRSNEFDMLVSRIQALKKSKNIPLKQLSILHNEFNNLYKDRLKNIVNKSSILTKEYDAKIRSKLDELIALIQMMILNIKQNQNQLIIKNSDAGLKAFRITVILSTLGIILGIGAAALTTGNIARSIQQLKLATNEISKGRFNHIPDVTAQDELGELANAFIKMAHLLASLEEANLNASPLTRLPGGIAIDNVLKNRLAASKSVTFCLLDIDNFKSFNDHYGYAAGNEVIKTTAKIIEKTIAEYGTNDDFVGHIGGDDFTILTTIERYNKLCTNIIEEFDKKIVDFYNTKDRANGYILGKTRQGKEIKFPIMSVSIAVVVSNKEKGQISHIEIGEIAAELKEKAKKIPGSVFMVNRRKK